MDQSEMKDTGTNGDIESDSQVLASATTVPHLHPRTVATAFCVTYQIADSRLKAMQESGLIERMGNGQYRILRNANS